MEWKELQTLVKRKIGYGIVQPGPSVQRGVPIIKVNNIISGLYDTEYLDKTTVENDAKYQRTKLKGGELIVTVVGTCGKTAIVPPHFAGCNLVRATCLIDIEDETICRWIKYYIDSPQGQAYINRNLNTTVQATLNVKNLNEMPIPFYSKEYTSNVVKILSSLDRKIELNNKINADLEEMAQAIFKNWFVDFEPFKDGKFVDSELGMIPEGWKVGTLGEFCKCLLGGTPSRSKEEYWNGEVNWINSGEINKFRILEASEKITELGLAKSATKLLPKKTTVLAITGATLGQVSLLEIDTCANQSVIGVLENTEVPYEYIYPFIKDRIEMLIQHQTGGAQQHINKDNVESLIFLLPAINVLEDYISLVSPMYKRIESQCFENLYLSTLRDTLLPCLMSGELEVPE